MNDLSRQEVGGKPDQGVYWFSEFGRVYRVNGNITPAVSIALGAAAGAVSAVPLGRVVEDDSDGVPHPRADPAHAVT